MNADQRQKKTAEDAKGAEVSSFVFRSSASSAYSAVIFGFHVHPRGLKLIRKRVEWRVMKIAIGADHAGFELKEKIKQRLLQEGYEVHDKGTHSTDSVDYPDFARLVGEEIAKKEAEFGVLVCGSGIGMSIAANKVPGVRAAHVTNMYEAQMAREHNNANVVTVGARVLDEWTAIQAIEKFLHTAFAGGRHERRVQKIMAIEQQEEPHHA